MTTAGEIRGKIRAKVDAKTIARMQALMANEGLYVLGYTAIKYETTSLISQLLGCVPRKRCRGVIACFSARIIRHRRNG